MEFFETDFTGPPYRLDKPQKDRILTGQLDTLTAYHTAHCPDYAHMLRAAGYPKEAVLKGQHYSELPFLPVGLFKRMRLESRSVSGEASASSRIKTVTSSGTSGQQTSQIILDSQTRILQQQALASIVSDFIGPKRIPMLVIDTESTVRKRDHFSARTAGIQGFSVCGTHRTFVLEEDLSLQTGTLEEFLDTYGDRPFLIFGFTWLVWKHFCLELEVRGLHPDLSNGILIHGGGWKKLTQEAVSEAEFRARLCAVCGLTKIHDYYGMAEQGGSIFMECEYGHLHASDYSDVLIRRADDFSLCDAGEKGIVQVLSVLPRSYPGHSLLTEDEGILLGRDDCPCGRKGAYFKICGRLAKAELRGCSDTAAARHKEQEWIQQQSGRGLLTGSEAGIQKGTGPAAGEHARNPDAAAGAITYVIGDAGILAGLSAQASFVSFAEETLILFDAWSQCIRADLRRRREAQETEDFAEASAFAFWCRRTHLEQLREAYAGRIANRIGFGVSLHYAAANVPALFAYSLSAALLAGCPAAVRLSSKEFLTQKILCDALDRALCAQPAMRERIVLFQSPHSEALNRALARLCRVRVVWGGDETVRQIGRIPLPANARQISFPDRTSAAVIRAQSILDADACELSAAVRDFYNDTYRNDQNACASPSLVYWLGGHGEIAKAQERFWKAVSAYARERYPLQDILAVQKTEQAYAIAAGRSDVRIASYGNHVVCVRLERFDASCPAYKTAGGFFIESGGQTTAGLLPALTDKVQTLICLGMDPEQLRREVRSRERMAPLRIVPCGHALDFDLFWDGHDLIREMAFLKTSRETV